MLLWDEWANAVSFEGSLTLSCHRRLIVISIMLCRVTRSSNCGYVCCLIGRFDASSRMEVRDSVFVNVFLNEVVWPLCDWFAKDFENPACELQLSLSISRSPTHVRLSNLLRSYAGRQRSGTTCTIWLSSLLSYQVLHLLARGLYAKSKYVFTVPCSFFIVDNWKNGELQICNFSGLAVGPKITRLICVTKGTLVGLFPAILSCCICRKRNRIRIWLMPGDIQTRLSFAI